MLRIHLRVVRLEPKDTYRKISNEEGDGNENRINPNS